MIGFSDASEQAYAAVLYLRLINASNQITSILIGSKTKVAHLKALTIPRLELCGMVLLAKLTLRVRKILDIEPNNVFCFSDSTIALSWLRGPTDKYQVFVRNRSNVINTIVPASRWFHINGDQNPADLCTRGITATKFLQSRLYWNHGPEWLTENFEEFLNTTIPPLEFIPEKSKSCTVAIATYDSCYFEHFSSFSRLVRVTAYILRLVDRIQQKLWANSRVLTEKEVECSEIRIIRRTQEFYYSKEYLALQFGKSLPARSCLNSLNTFIHVDGLIRIGGRLKNAALMFDQKHPIVLPRNCHISMLIIRDLHERYFHANYLLLLSFVRRKWWIIGGVNKLVKSVIHNCVYCTRINAKLRHQIMSDLPAARVQISRPFSHTGVDYASPFGIKCTNHRSIKHNKAYLAFFICFSTKAVHIEVVSELTIEAFMFTFDRFIARRVLPLVMYSDNATNFVGFANLINQYQLCDYATKHHFEWKFIPARSPHIGGLWEAAVKAGKRLLVKAVGQQVLTLEQLNTITTKVEEILNSRPLCRDLTVELNYLTPLHFLIGGLLLDMPVNETTIVTLPQRYKLIHQIINSFWVTWKKDYLILLQTRSK